MATRTVRAGRPAAERVADALAARPGATVAEVAAATGLGQSTAGKALVGLEAAGTTVRRPGGRDGSRRLPDRWTTTTRTTTAAIEASSPGDDLPSAGRAGDRRGAVGRLGKGQLREIVAGLLADCTQPVTASGLAKAAGGRSAGAVGNALDRLVRSGSAVQVTDHPKAYLPATPPSRRGPRR